MKSWCWLAALMLVIGVATAAEPAKQQGITDNATDSYAAFLAANATLGPVDIAVRDQAVLAAPPGYAFLAEKPAREFMKRLGNSTDDNFIGLVMSKESAPWFATLRYMPAGYVKDDDAKNWNADDLLKSIKEGTEEDNITRRKDKIAELEILGWAERPHYDAVHHRLIWSIEAREKGSSANQDLTINYHTLGLGRNGYVILNLVTVKSRIATDKIKAQELLSHLEFKTDKRYGDFNASTDHIAEYGLAALIGGVVAKKIGFFALAAVFLAKWAKILGVMAVAGLAWLRKFWRRKKDDVAQPEATQPPPTTSPPPEPPVDSRAVQGPEPAP